MVSGARPLRDAARKTLPKAFASALEAAANGPARTPVRQPDPQDHEEQRTALSQKPEDGHASLKEDRPIARV